MQSCKWLRTLLVCKDARYCKPCLLHKDDYLCIHVALNGTKDFVQLYSLKCFFLIPWNCSNQNHTCWWQHSPAHIINKHLKQQFYRLLSNKVKIKEKKKKWIIMIVISQILSLWSNSVINATLEGSEHAQVSCTRTGQMPPTLQNSMAKQRHSSQHRRVQLLILQLGNAIFSLALSPKQSRSFIE